MARTKAEVRAFLDSKVGTIVPHPGYPDLNGQCVTLTKALMEFLGVPNPYKARGNARDAGDTMLREGIAKQGKGWLTVVVNRDMGLIGGVRYGHIWVDLLNETNYESNGARALYTTKGTRPITQGQQFINLDQWISEGETVSKTDLGIARILSWAILGRNGTDGRGNSLNGNDDGDLNQYHINTETNGEIWALYNSGEGQDWIHNRLPRLIDRASKTDAYAKQLSDANGTIQRLNAQIADLGKRPTQEQLQALTDAAAKANEDAAKAKIELDRVKAEQDADRAAGDSFLRRIGQFISKYLPGGK